MNKVGTFSILLSWALTPKTSTLDIYNVRERMEKSILGLVRSGRPPGVVALRDDELCVSRAGERVGRRKGRAYGTLSLRHSSGAALCAYRACRAWRPAGFHSLFTAV